KSLHSLEDSDMSMSIWTPMGQALNLQRRLSSLFDEASRGVFDEGGRSAASQLATDSFVPPVDVFEDGKSIGLKFEIPGVKQEDLDIRIENNILHVSGERKFEAETHEQNYHRIERRYGVFSRSFTLPPSVDTNSVQATYDNGVLTITLAKRAEAQPKQIKVAVGGAKPQQQQVEGTAKSQQQVQGTAKPPQMEAGKESMPGQAGASSATRQPETASTPRQTDVSKESKVA
ncbi:MAG TPA: Hsp20/alpha crystallin family protein, partial [Acidobacteriaceae bacterium]|nr:Hsp20/alpha crystallin family protein [Acidobacteriaceae bacterium]